MNQLTIATTVYNRADLIKRLFDSLQKQTDKKFIWLVIDDGSVDNIDRVMDILIPYAEFEISYWKQQNGGKCSALNYAIDQCKTEIFFVVDSDDWLIPEAVETILGTWNSVRHNSDIVGIVAHRQFENGRISGGEFPKEVQVVSYNTLNYHYGKRGETALIYRTALMKKYKFPVFPEENFLSEEIQYSEVDKEGVFHILPKALIVCEYQEDGLTKNYLKNWIQNPKGTKLLLSVKYNHVLYLDRKDVVIKKMKAAIQYDICHLYSSEFHMQESPNPLLGWLCMPIAKMLKAIKYKIE